MHVILSPPSISPHGNTCGADKEPNIELIKILKQYEEEHRDLDEIINQMHSNKTINLEQIKRMKKRKLLLKDKISQIKDELEPDIIA